MAKKSAAKPKRNRKAPRRGTAGARNEGASKQSRRSAVDAAHVSVRMFRQGLGDAFLLQFPKAGGTTFSMLIDCGVLVGTADGADRMRKIVAEIGRLTSKSLDLLVITHEHWDHLSGFIQARDLFQTIRVRRIWMAWTEAPDDPQAQLLRRERTRRQKALQLAVKHLQGARRNSFLAADVRNVLGFFGVRQGTADALQAVRELAPSVPEYLEPGAPPRTLRGLPGVRFYVLGPPKGDLLFKDAPSKRNPEVYTELHAAAMGSGAEASFVAALAAQDDTEIDLGDEIAGAGGAFAPFDVAVKTVTPDEARHAATKLAGDEEEYRKRTEALAARQTELEQRRESTKTAASAGQPVVDPEVEALALRINTLRADLESRRATLERDAARSYERYYDPQERWRSIESDWLDAAGPLALKLDSDTNNTSLVLAIELVESGRVLLFPGDAQVGNWLSWHQLPGWRVSDGSGRRKRVTTEDLLRRTVLYKVGHHGSHNATLRGQGLELMTSPELAAMIPVDEKLALSQKPHEWKMPFPPLYDALQERTLGRVLRGDRPVDKLKRPGSTPAAVWQQFLDAVDDSELSVEYRVPLAD